jgi:hypothetical protein
MTQDCPKRSKWHVLLLVLRNNHNLVTSHEFDMTPCLMHRSKTGSLQRPTNLCLFDNWELAHGYQESVSTKMTNTRAGPCTPTVSDISMSAVRLGPVTSEA